MQRILLVATLLLIHGTLVAQLRLATPTPNPSEERQVRLIPPTNDLPGERQVRRFTSDDGLPANTIFSMARDSLGFFWFFTSGGASRFDGYQFETIPSPADPETGAKDNYLFRAKHIPEFGFFAWSNARTYQLNTKTNTLENLVVLPQLRMRLDGNLFEFRGELVLSSDQGLFKLSQDGRLVAHANAPAIPTNIDFSIVNAIERNDTIWVIHANTLLHITDFDTVNIAGNLPDNLSFDAVKLSFAADSSSLWVSLTEGLQRSWLSRFDIRTGTFADFELIQPGINGMVEDAKGRLWMTTNSDGLFVRHPDGVLQKYPYLEDKLLFAPQLVDNILWLNTNGNGLVRIDLHPSRFGLIPRNSRFDAVTIGHLTKNIYLNDNSLWLLDPEPPYSLFHIDRYTGRGQRFTFPIAHETTYIIDMATADGRIFWLGSYSTPVLRFDAQTGDYQFLPELSNFTTNVSPVGVLALTPEAVWITNNTSIGKYDIETQELTQYELPGANKREIGYWQFDGFIDDSGENLWFPKHEEIKRFHIPSQTFSSIRIPQAGSSQVKHLAFYKGRLTAAIENGLALIDTSSGRIDFFDKENGLPDNFIYGFLADEQQNLWISSNRGITRAQFDVQPDTVIARFKNYTYADGLQSNEFNSYNFFKESDGTMWFGGIGGLNWFNPDKIDEIRAPVSVLFTNLTVLDSPNPTSINLMLSPGVHLAHDQRTFTVDYVGIDPLYPENLRYAYLLEGFDEQWVNSETQRSARFTNIPSGCYRLGVRVSYDGENWQEPIWLPITIARPFWQEAWFLALSTLLLVGLVFGIGRIVSEQKYRARLREFEKRDLVNLERSRIARDLHDEIGANLTQIAILSDIMLQDTPAEATSEQEMMRRVARVARENITNLSEIVWSLNPHNDNLEQFASYVQEYTENFFAPTAVRTHFEIDETFAEVNLDAQLRHHLLMSVKEILHNCLKHAHAETVHLKISHQQNRLEISVRDDGRGFDQSAAAATTTAAATATTAAATATTAAATATTTTAAATTSAAATATTSAGVPRGNGIRNLSERIRQFGGMVSIQSTRGEGCYVLITVPV